MICYELLPVDFGLENLPTLDEYLRKLLGEVSERPIVIDSGGWTVTAWGDVLDEARGVVAEAKEALDLAKRHGWEGDIRDGKGPRVMLLPNGSDAMELAFIWKQNNNGTTFFVSPYRLPWLDQAALSGRIGCD